MALPTQLKDFFNYTVTIEPYSSDDGYGKPTYGTGVEVPAKMEHSNEYFRLDDEQEIVSQRKIFLYTQTVPDPRDRVTLPSAFGPQTVPKILRIRVVTDVSNTKIHHIVLYTD